jgi:phosphoribosylanthranilate isomerase
VVVEQRVLIIQLHQQELKARIHHLQEQELLFLLVVEVVEYLTTRRGLLLEITEVQVEVNLKVILQMV